jgi:GMP synthase (glutamine-hydrolysing)
MRVLALQHIACEPPGVFEDVLVERGHELVRVELDEGEPLPGGTWDAIVAMGGPMSVNDESEHPWLVGEKALIESHVRAGRPFWGSCLGAQLLAAALGARVYAGPDGGVLLASSPAYPNQAFRVGPVAYAVQFHVEVTEAMGEEWAGVPAYAEYADRVLGPGGSEGLLAQFRVSSPRMQEHARVMFERWCELAEAP